MELILTALLTAIATLTVMAVAAHTWATRTIRNLDPRPDKPATEKRLSQMAATHVTDPSPTASPPGPDRPSAAD